MLLSARTVICPLTVPLSSLSARLRHPQDDQPDPTDNTEDHSDGDSNAMQVQPPVDQPAHQTPDDDPADQVTEGGVCLIGAGRVLVDATLDSGRLVIGHDARTISAGYGTVRSGPRGHTPSGGQSGLDLTAPASHITPADPAPIPHTSGCWEEVSRDLRLILA